MGVNLELVGRGGHIIRNTWALSIRFQGEEAQVFLAWLGENNLRVRGEKPSRTEESAPSSQLNRASGLGAGKGYRGRGEMLPRAQAWGEDGVL